MSLNLSHHFLISMPSLEDAFFKKSLVYIFQHDQEGCIGAIINKPVATTLDQLLPEMETEFPHADAKLPLHFGGPVSMEQGMIIHTKKINDEHCLHNGYIQFSHSLTALKEIVGHSYHSDFLICMGYSGWSPGQVEEELKDNAWLPVEADLEILFHKNPYVKYDLALQKLGIDPAFMSQTGGNA